MNEDKVLLKFVGYAYPSSITANKQGFKNGCWYVSVGVGEYDGSHEIYMASESKKDAFDYANSLDYPFDIYSMKEED